MEDNVVAVLGLDKGTGFIKAVTSCLMEEAQRFAKYYRSIGYKAKIVGYEELTKMLEEEKQYRMKYSGIF